MIKGNIFNIQHFSDEDGPGIRTTVFLKGCNLHCPWCHNPESQSLHKEIMYFEQKCITCKKCLAVCPQDSKQLQKILVSKGQEFFQSKQHPVFSKNCLHCGSCADVCPTQALVEYGKQWDLEEVVSEVLQDKDLYDMSGGGVTFSGGEPLLQIDFLEALAKRLKENGIHTAIETAGCYETARLERILPYVDYIFMDFKCLDEKKHTEVIGMSNRKVLQNLKMLGQYEKEVVIRIPVIVGFNNMELVEMAEFIKGVPEHIKVELLPYHDICFGKYEALHRKFQVEGYKIPTEQEMSRYKKLFGGRIQ